MAVSTHCIPYQVPWFSRLLAASAKERDRWEILGDGEGIHWPEIDEDLSIAGLLVGGMAPGGRRSSDEFKVEG